MNDIFGLQEITVDQARKLWEAKYLVKVIEPDYNINHCFGCPPGQWASGAKYYLSDSVTAYDDYKLFKAPVDSIDKLKALYISKLTSHRLSDLLDIKVARYNLCTNPLGTTSDKMIYNGPSGNFYVGKEQKLPIKLGKVIKQLLPEASPLEIEGFVSTWKKAYTVDTSTVELRDDIVSIYDEGGSVGGSCMSGYGDRLEIYEDLGCKLLCSFEANGITLNARAIVWYNNLETVDGAKDVGILVDRIFYNTENAKLTIQKYVEEQGWKFLYENDDIPHVITKESVGSYAEVPYIDTVYNVLTVDGFYKLTTETCCDDRLQQTDGSSESLCGISEMLNEDYIYCIDSDDRQYQDDCYYCETDDEWYCSDEYLVYVYGRGYYLKDDDNLGFFEDTKEYFHHCDNNTVYTTVDGEHYSDCMDLIYCEDIDGWLHENDCYYYVEDLAVYYSTDSDLLDYEGNYYSSQEAIDEIKENKDD